MDGQIAGSPWLLRAASFDLATVIAFIIIVMKLPFFFLPVLERVFPLYVYIS